MREPSKAIQNLATLLQGSSAKPLVVPSRLAPSPIYDLEYRAAVICLVFEAFARPQGGSTEPKISAARVKLLQFASIRPWLLPAIREWSEESRQAPLNLTHSTRIRRGFLSDTAYDDVLNFLVASTMFIREGGQIALGAKGEEVRKIVGAIEEQGLFVSERRAIAVLGDIKITNNMLEGW